MALSKTQRSWINVIAAAGLMLTTLPGRTQGLGLITEPMLGDLQIERVTYANINLWATLIGALACFPAGWLLDRYGFRWVSGAIVLSVGLVVWQMSRHTGGASTLFVLILLSRALGQSALSVASITAVARSFPARSTGMAMAVYSVLLSLLFFWAFTHVGAVVRESGWRTAWLQIATALMVGAPLAVLLLSKPGLQPDGEKQAPSSGLTLREASRTPAFWVFAGAASMFGLASSGLGLFNEAVLAELGFDQKAFHTILAATAIVSLAGQMLCGLCARRWGMERLLAIAMLLYAISLFGLPFLKSMTQLWSFAVVAGISAGMVTVLFFAVWRTAFGERHVGMIQGAAQMLTVLGSAVGPLLFARSVEMFGSYSPILFALGAIVLLFAAAAWWTKTRNPGAGGVPSNLSQQT